MKLKAKDRKSPGQIPLLKKLDNWLARYRVWVIVVLLTSWIAIRVASFSFMVNSPLYNMYLWSESDNRFFDDWAKYLNHDWLNKKPLHHYHSWHEKFARFYFQKHPDKLQEILELNPNRDSTFIAGKELWNEWYKGTQYHQEPLYAYTLALFYFINANAIKAMMILQLCLGVLSGIVLFVLSRKYFGETVAALTGILYLLCGVVFIHEVIILRTSWIGFFTILNVWLIDRALVKQRTMDFLLCGVSLGFSVLIWSAFSLFLYGMLAIAFFVKQKGTKHYLKASVILVAGFFAIRSPVIIRNLIVGAPVLGSASGVESTFISTNAFGVENVSGWAPIAERDAEILGQTYNSLPRAIVATLKTHPSIGSYLSLLYLKLKAIWRGIEWPDNVNYYFYKLYVPVLKFAFFDFFWVAPLGLAGLIFCFYDRKKYFALYLGILINLAILMAFHVLGRYRTPLVFLCLPLAAFAIVNCVDFLAIRKWNAAWKPVLVILLLYLSFSNHFQDVSSQLRTADFAAVYDNYYTSKFEKLEKEGKWGDISVMHRDFLNMKPDFVRNVKTQEIIVDEKLIFVADYFSQHHHIQSNIYKLISNTNGASLELDTAKNLDQVVEKSKKRLGIK